MAHIQVCEEMSGLGGMASVTSAIFLPCSPGRLHLSQVNNEQERSRTLVA